MTGGLGLVCGGRPGQQRSHIIDSICHNLHVDPTSLFGLPFRPACSKTHPGIPRNLHVLLAQGLTARASEGCWAHVEPWNTMNDESESEDDEDVVTFAAS